MRDIGAPKSVLFVKLSSLGDVVHSLPLIESLRSGLGPDVLISWAVRQAFAPLLRGNPHLNEAYPLEGRGVGTYLKFGRTLGSHEFDVALDGQGLLISGILSRLSGAPRRIGFDLNRECNAMFLTDPVVPGRTRQHVVDRLLGFCDVMGVPRLKARPQTYLSDAEADQARTLLATGRREDDPVVGCIIGASTADKTWPAARWAETAARLAASGVRVVLLGGKGEGNAAGEIIAVAPPGSIAANLVGQTPLPVLASVLARCGVVVGGDSGPTHLAVAVGTPVVGLYGVTDPVRTGPGWGAAPSIVLDYAEGDAPPAERRPRHSKLPDALSRIPADAVTSAALKLLGDHRRDGYGKSVQ